MDLKFTKMQGCGNDYIYIDCFKQTIINPEQLSVKLSSRHYGVGGDGVILICPSSIADAKMSMFNLDGSEGKMCGNGIRCVGKYLFDNKIVSGNKAKIETQSGIKELKALFSGEEAEFIRVNMGLPEFDPQMVPVKINAPEVTAFPIHIDGQTFNITCVSMGNPHCVTFCQNVNKLNLERIGPLFEKNELFPQGVNTEFVEIVNDTCLKMRVWERGSGETLACGTGACAAAVAAVKNGYGTLNSKIKIELLGGDLTIEYTDKTVFLTGQAKKVFEGVVCVDQIHICDRRSGIGAW